MKSKKGEIGTTLTWTVAIIIISFILVIFLVVTLFISKNKVSDDGVSIVGSGNNQELTMKTLYFLKEHSSELSEWADKGNKQLFCNSLNKEFLTEPDYINSVLYFDLKEEKLDRKLKIKFNENSLSLVDCWEGSLSNTLFSSERVNTYYLSEEGNLIQIIYGKEKIGIIS